MRHVILTCKHHPELRWSCKSIAFSPGHSYNGIRNIFFDGYVRAEDKVFKPVRECPCSPADLILAPEEIEKQKVDPTYDANGRDID